MSLRDLISATALILLLAAAPAHAQVNPEPKSPYIWQIVVKVQNHPLFSPTFREQLKRDLEASLQPVLGSLGTVVVIDLASTPRANWEPLWDQFEEKGFAALETPRDLTGIKTHFLKIEYKDGQYLLEARQYDGFTGLSSGFAGFGTPVIRKHSTRSPELVGLTAGKMLDRDFGLEGTVEIILGTVKEVKVIVRGGQLGPLDRFVKPGEVFAVSDVIKTDRAAPVQKTATGKIITPPPGSVPPPALSAKLRAACLLKVLEVGTDGTLRCEVLNRFFQPGERYAAHRCLKLGTFEAPLTVRLVSSKGIFAKTAGNVSVRASEKGFDVAEDARDVLEYRDGVFRSTRPLSNLACLTVSSGPTQRRKVPIPILGTDPVNLVYETDPREEEQAAFDRAALALLSQVSDARNAQAVCYSAMCKLIDKGKNQDALDRAKNGYKAAADVAATIADELKQLKESIDKSPNFGPKLMKGVDQKLNDVLEFNKQWGPGIAALETVVEREKDPTKNAQDLQALELLGRINILLGRGEVEEALNAYDQVVTLLPGNAEKKAQQAKLKADWAPKNDAHAKARDYLLKTWPNVATIQDYKDSLPELKRTIDVCKQNSDKYALRRLLVIFNVSTAKLRELADALDASSDADRKLAADAKTAGDELQARENEIREYLKKFSE